MIITVVNVQNVGSGQQIEKSQMLLKACVMVLLLMVGCYVMNAFLMTIDGLSEIELR